MYTYMTVFIIKNKYLKIVTEICFFFVFSIIYSKKVNCIAFKEIKIILCHVALLCYCFFLINCSSESVVKF